MLSAQFNLRERYEYGTSSAARKWRWLLSPAGRRAGLGPVRGRRDRDTTREQSGGQRGRRSEASYALILRGGSHETSFRLKPGLFPTTDSFDTAGEMNVRTP